MGAGTRRLVAVLRPHGKGPARLLAVHETSGSPPCREVLERGSPGAVPWTLLAGGAPSRGTKNSLFQIIRFRLGTSRGSEERGSFAHGFLAHAAPHKESQGQSWCRVWPVP